MLLAGLSALLPMPLLSAPSARVTIIGGGFGGATCARILRRYAPEIEVTLIEPRAAFYTGIYCNAAITGVTELGDVIQSPAATEQLGVRWIQQAALEIDPVRKRIRLDDGRSLDADFVVLSPGIEMIWNRIEGINAANSDHMPHAWLGDAQVLLMKRRLRALEDGSTIVIAAPPNPYRCPPGPYERASLFAWQMMHSARRCKIIIADAKDDFSKRVLFQLGWDTLYPNRIEWVPRAQGGEVVSVDHQRNTVHLANGERIHADLVNLIPPQRAAGIAHHSGLTDASGWCPIFPESFESSLHAGVHVIGDAAAAQPVAKSAFSAHVQGTQVALSIAARVRGEHVSDPTYLNTCYSLLAPDYGISISSVYTASDGYVGTRHTGISPLSGDRALRAREAQYAHALYAQITRNSFGR